jgi:hypothetical protein
VVACGAAAPPDVAALLEPAVAGVEAAAAGVDAAAAGVDAAGVLEPLDLELLEQPAISVASAATGASSATPRRRLRADLLKLMVSPQCYGAPVGHRRAANADIVACIARHIKM